MPLDIEEMNESELEDEPQKFIFKLSDRLGNPLVPDQAQLMNLRNEEPLYMSPHLFESFLNGHEQIKLNPFKNDIFALGLIILEAGLLEPVQEVYNYNTAEFQFGFLENFKTKFYQKYDDAILRELLDKILEVDDDKRVTPIKLQKTVNTILASLENEDMDAEEQLPEEGPMNDKTTQEEQYYNDEDVPRPEHDTQEHLEEPQSAEDVPQEELSPRELAESRNQQRGSVKDQYLQQLEEEYQNGTQGTEDHVQSLSNQLPESIPEMEEDTQFPENQDSDQRPEQEQTQIKKFPTFKSPPETPVETNQMGEASDENPNITDRGPFHEIQGSQEDYLEPTGPAEKEEEYVNQRTHPEEVEVVTLGVEEMPLQPESEQEKEQMWVEVVQHSGPDEEYPPEEHEEAQMEMKTFGNQNFPENQMDQHEHEHQEQPQPLVFNERKANQGKPSGGQVLVEEAYWVEEPVQPEEPQMEEPVYEVNSGVDVEFEKREVEIEEGHQEPIEDKYDDQVFDYNKVENVENYQVSPDDPVFGRNYQVNENVNDQENHEDPIFGGKYPMEERENIFQESPRQPQMEGKNENQEFGHEEPVQEITNYTKETSNEAPLLVKKQEFVPHQNEPKEPAQLVKIQFEEKQEPISAELVDEYYQKDSPQKNIQNYYQENKHRMEKQPQMEQIRMPIQTQKEENGNYPVHYSLPEKEEQTRQNQQPRTVQDPQNLKEIAQNKPQINNPDNYQIRENAPQREIVYHSPHYNPQPDTENFAYPTRPVQHQVHQPTHYQPHEHQPVHHPEHANQPLHHQIHQPVHQQVHQPVHHQVHSPVHHQVHSPVHQQIHQPVYQQVHQPIHQQMYQPVHQQIHHPSSNQVYHLVQKDSNNDMPYKKIGLQTKQPENQNSEKSSQKEIDLQNIESYKNDPSTKPVSYIDHNKKVKPIQKQSQEMDIPFQAKPQDEPLYRLVSKDTFEKKPQDEIMQESVVHHVEISKELPKNNGLPDDKPFEAKMNYEDYDQNYFQNVKRNYDQQYQHKYINPHLDGNQMIHPGTLDELKQINEKNKKLNAEYISQQMKIGSNEQPKELKKIKLNDPKQPNGEPQKLSNIEGLTPHAEENVKFMSGQEIHHNILNRNDDPMKEFIKPDEPFHHNIGVTLNQINTFASKNTQILEGQNESIVPETDQSELMTPAKVQIARATPPQRIENLFRSPNESREVAKQSFEFKSSGSRRSNHGSAQEIQTQRISHPVQRRPIEVISFKKQVQPNVENLNADNESTSLRLTSSPNYTNVFRSVEPVANPVGFLQKDSVQTSFKSSYMTESVTTKPSELVLPDAQVQFSSQPSKINQVEKKKTVETPTSSKIIGKYEVLFNPETKKKRIVITSKPIKFSHRVNPRPAKEAFKSSQQNFTSSNYNSKTNESSLTNTPFKNVPNENYTPIRTQSKQIYTRPSETKQAKTVSRNSIPNEQVSTPKVTRISITSGNITRYTSSQSRTDKEPQRTRVTPRDAYDFDAPKIVRVSHNVPSKQMRVSQTTGQSTISSYSNANSHRPFIRTIPAQSNVTNRTVSNVVRSHANGAKEMYKGSSNPGKSRVISTLRGTYNNANRVNAFSSKTGAVNYISKKQGPKTATQPRVIRASQNIPKNSVRYEKLQSQTFARRKNSFE